MKRLLAETAIWANQKQNQARSGQILTAYAKLDPSVLPTMVRARYGERRDPADG